MEVKTTDNKILRIKDDIEKVMRVAVRDIDDGVTKIKLLEKLAEAVEIVKERM